MNLAVEKRVISMTTIFENSEGSENQYKSITEEPLNSANPSNKPHIKESNLINIVAPSIISIYRLHVPPTLLPEQLLELPLLPHPFPLP
ncbi:hypothetical protein JSMCR1_p431 (plasmid) [Escherichia coli]|jgi:hypothetical protein|uniref:hypothetical protein n=1 Tax=Escherichia coli TaxID=562 RepID=UPI0022009990|nr:hypothetical protein [Escherichia coli]UUF22107.1 hypothetical protein JSMCR1_p431 [Escherichia coli]